LPLINNVNLGGAYCSGGTGVTVRLDNSQTGIHYNLYRDAIPTGVSLPGNTGNELLFNNQTAAGLYTVVAVNPLTGCTANMTGSATVTINPLPTQYLLTGSSTYCFGDVIGKTISLQGSQNGFSYQLYKDGFAEEAPIPGNGALREWTGKLAGSFTVVATNPATSCTSTMNGTVIISELAKLLITSSPVDATVCEGSTTSYTISATGVNPTYQWYRNNAALADGTFGTTIITGATTSVLAINGTPLTYNNSDIHCVVSSTCSETETSNTVKLNVKQTTEISTAPVSTTVCQGSSHTFTVAANGSNLTYTWKDPNGNTIANTAGKYANATTSSLTILNIASTDAGFYTCYVQGDCGNVTQTAAVLTVDSPITITTFPQHQSACIGSNVSYTTAATGGSGLTYEWWFRKNGDAVFTSLATGATLALNTIDNDDAGDYYCIITSVCGETETTNTVKLTVLASTTLTAISISNSVVCEGSTVNLTVTGSAQDAVYKWYKSGNITPLSNTVGKISGAGTANLTLSDLALTDAGGYRAKIEGTCGELFSDEVSLSVREKITSALATPLTKAICPGTNATFSVAITGGAYTSLQWEVKNGAAFIDAPGTSTNLNYTTDVAGVYRLRITTETCGTYYSNEVTLTLNDIISITSLTATRTVCEGEANIVFAVVPTGNVLNYVWDKNGAVIAGETGSSYTLPLASAGNYRVTATGSCNVVSSTGTLNVDVKPIISVDPISQVLCNGSDVEMSVTLSAGTNPTFQWYLNNVAITDSTRQVYYIEGFDATMVGDYHVTVSNTGCGTATSNKAKLSLVNPFSITVHPVAKTLCEGSPATFKVETDNPTQVSYQWRKNGVNLPGKTANLLTVENITQADAGLYSCMVFNSCTTIVSNTAELKVASNSITITKHPLSKTSCLGDNFALTAEGTTPNGTLSYTWYKVGSAVAVGTGSSYPFNPFIAAQAGIYYCVISNGCTSVTTSNAEIKAGVASNPADLDDITLCVGEDAHFTVGLVTGHTYRWYKDDQALTDSPRITGSQTNSLSITNLIEDDQATYSCEVIGTCGEPATVSAFLNIITLPQITANPNSRTICSNQANVSFSVTVTGDAPETYTYKWQFRTGLTSTWGDVHTSIAVDNERILTITSPNATNHNGFYRCVITSTCGIINSTAAQLAVEPIVTITPPVLAEINKTECEQNNVSFTVNVSGPSNMALQWYKDGSPLANSARIDGVNLNVLSINNITSSDAGAYWCVITSSCGNVSTGNYTLTVNNRAVITQQPMGGRFCPGGSVNLITTASGTVDYQWQELLGAVWTNIAGATANSYSASAAGTYRCVLTNICDVLYTDQVVVETAITTISTINPASPANPICEGQNVNLSVNANGTNLSYRWYKGETALTDGARIGGSQTSSLTINGLLPSDKGIYRVAVYGLCGDITDNSISLDVQQKISVSGPASTTVKVGNQAVFSVSALGTVATPIGYQWYHMPTTSTTWNLLAGETNATLTILAADYDDAGSYKCVVFGDICNDVESNSATLTVLAEKLIKTDPATPVTICQGLGFTLFIETNNPVDSYQWLRNDVAIPGANSHSLTITSAMPSQSGAYTCKVVKDGIEDRSAASIVSVNPTTIITLGPTGGSKCEGEMHTFTVEATGKAPLSYEWFRIDGNNVTTSVANTQEYTINSLDPVLHSGTYYCQVTATGGCGGVQTSGAVTLVVNKKMIVTYDLALTGNNPACQGETLSLEFNVTGDNLTYTWQKNGLAITDANITGTNTKKLQISSAVPSNTGDYTCVVSSTCGSTVYTSTSNVRKITITPKTEIISQPISRTKCELDDAIFTVVASGNILLADYSWYYKKTETAASVLVSSLSLPGAVITTNTTTNTSSLTISNLSKSDHEGTYWVEINSTCNPIIGEPLRSTTANLIVNKWIEFTDPNPTISTNPMCQGGNTTISISAVGDGLSYLWKRDGEEIPVSDTGISGRTSSQLVISNALVSYGGVYTCTIFGQCGNSETSNEVVLTVNPTVSIVSQTLGTFDRCAGNEVIFTVEATGTNPTFTWMKGGANGTNITALPVTTATLTVSSPSANISRLRISGITPAEAGSYTCVVSANCGSGVSTVNSESVVLAVSSGIQITKEPNNPNPIVTICQGTETELSVVATGTITGYRWLRNGEYITANEYYSGVTSSTLVIAKAQPALNGVYTCEITGPCNFIPLVSQMVELVVSPLPSITKQPVASTTVCQNDNIQLIAEAIGSLPLVYEWWFKKLGSNTNINLTLPANTPANVSGVSSSVLTINSITSDNAGAYTLVVTGSNATCGSTTSNAANVTVNPRPTITTQPLSTTVCQNNTAIFNVLATGTGTLEYKWKFNDVILANGGKISGANTNQLTITSATQANVGLYKVQIFSSCGNIESNVVTLGVTDSTRITAQPISQNVIVGEEVIFNVDATGENLWFEWQRDGVAVGNGKSYSITSAQIGDAGQYRAVVTGSCGVVNSSAAFLTVYETVNITSSDLLDQSVCEGQSTGFSVEVTGTVLGYQWQFNGANLSDGNGYSGAKTANLVISPAKLVHAGSYVCVITGPKGQEIRTNAAKLSVNDKVNITSSSPSQKLCFGDWLVLEAIATGSNVAYKWQKDGTDIDATNSDSRISGKESSKLVITSVTNTDAGQYTCIVSNNCDTKQTSTAVITVDPIISILTETPSQILCEQQTVTLSVTTNITGTRYQWYKGNAEVQNNATFSGATTADLTIRNLAVADAGIYICRVWNGTCSSDVSGSISLAVLSKTVIISEPTSVTHCIGTSAKFEVNASGTGLAFKWYKDNVAIADITGVRLGTESNVLTIISVADSDKGVYRCEITGGCNVETTSAATLSVISLPANATTITGSPQVCQGAQFVNYFVPEIANAQSYEWDLPFGATIVGGAGTRSIQVNFANNAVASRPLRVRGVNSCGAGGWSSLAVAINSLPTANAGLDFAECSFTVQLNGNNTTGGEWTIISGDGIIADINLHNTSVNNLKYGDNTFRWTVTTAEGCTAYDEVKVTNLKVPVDAGPDQVICSNRAIMNAITPLTNASWRVVSGQGNGAIISPNSPTTMIDGLAQGTNTFAWYVNNQNCFSFDEVTITNNAPVYPDAGDDQIIAFNSTSLNAKEPEAGTTGFWDLISGGGTFADANSFATTIDNLMPGDNIIVWTVIRESCTLSDTVTIKNLLLEPANAGPDQTICVNFTNLSAKPADKIGEGAWSVITGGGVFVEGNNPFTKVSNLAQGTNVLRWTVTTSLSGSTSTYDEVTIINNMPTKANAGAGESLCTNQINLNANVPASNGGIGTWIRIGGTGVINDVLDAKSLVTNLSSGSNIFRWTIDNNGCISSDFVEIFNNTPTTADAGENETLCTDQTILRPNSPTFGTGQWSVKTGRGVFDPVNKNKVTQLAPDLNTFVYTITNGNCSSTDEVDIINNKPTTPDAGYDKSICVDNIQLNANLAIEGTGVWSIVSGSGTILPAEINTPNPNVTALATGPNIFKWTISKNSCSESDMVVISNDRVEAFAGDPQTLCENFTVLKATAPQVGSGSWSIVGGSSASFDNITSPNSAVRNLSKGDNTLRWTVVKSECKAQSDVTITNNQPSTPRAGEDQSICGKTATLNAFIPTPLVEVGEWVALGGSAEFADKNNPKTTISKLSEGQNILRWTITRGNCSLFDDVIITSNEPEDVFAGNDQEVCSNVATLAANNPTLGTGSWVIVSGAGSFVNRFSNNTQVRNLGKGENVFRWTVTSQDCKVQDDVKITSNIPSTSIAGANQILCTNTAELGANVPTNGTGSWLVQSGSVEFIDPTKPNTNAINIAPGSNTIIWQIRIGDCTSESELTLTNNQPSIPYAGNPRSICADSTRLNAEPPLIGTGRWTTLGEGNILNPMDPYSRVVNMSYGANTFRWTVTNINCVLTHDVIITSNLAYANAGRDTTVNTSSIQLIANVPTIGSGAWTLIGGSDKTKIETPTNYTTLVTNLNAGPNVFRWSINNQGCISFDEVSVNYIVWPTVDFDPSTLSELSGCPPFKIDFKNKTVGGAPYTWNFGDGTAPVNQEHTSHIFTQPGKYVVKLTATAPGTNNTVSEQKTVTVHTLPAADFAIAPNLTYIYKDKNKNIRGKHVSTYNYSYQADTSFWNFGDGKALVKKFAPTYMYSDTGWFDISLVVMNKFGCTDTLNKPNALHVVYRSDFFFPEAFTPNPTGPTGGLYDPVDRSNDVFYPIIINGEISDFEMKIFNRAGVLIFKSNDVNIGWDGYYKNKLLPQGIYVYSVSGRFNSGEPFNQAGTVLLIVKNN
jgi:gliding motility-associated-like protein